MAYLEPSQTSTMELCTIVDAQQGSKYASDLPYLKLLQQNFDHRRLMDYASFSIQGVASTNPQTKWVK